MQEIIEFESVIEATGGARVTAVQCVEHCSADGGEGHCHLRVRRADSSTGDEWVTSAGTAAQLSQACDRLGLAAPIERYDEMHEADERGLPPTTLAALESASGDAKARADARDPARDGSGAARASESRDCSVCMEPLDVLHLPGGFAHMTAPTISLPCGHEYHAACVKGWLARHTTCPCCREEVTDESIAAMAAGRPQATSRPSGMAAC